MSLEADAAQPALRADDAEKPGRRRRGTDAGTAT